MRKRFLNILALMMTLVILMSSIGINIFEHVCKKEALYKYSMLDITSCSSHIQKEISCCSKKTNSCHIESIETENKSCCSTGFSYENLEIETLLSKIQETSTEDLLVSFVLNYNIKESNDFIKDSNKFLDHLFDPPLLLRDCEKTLFFQSFLC